MTLAQDIFAPMPGPEEYSVKEVQFVGTVEQAYEYFGQHMQDGKAKFGIYLDQRGMSYIEPRHHGNIGLAIPDDGDSVDDRVFMRAIYQ